MDIEMFGKLSDAFGPSGFEEDVIRTIADYCKEFDVENEMCIRDRIWHP